MAGNRKNNSKIKYRRQRGTFNLLFRAQYYKKNTIISYTAPESELNSWNRHTCLMSSAEG